MKKLLVLNVAGLSRRLLGQDTPYLNAMLKISGLKCLDPILPAVTCSAQAGFLTGKTVDSHGIVGNGWFFKDLNEVAFWKQSHALIQAETIWKRMKLLRPDLITANTCWWYNMQCGADASVTPRPIYRADGQKIPDCYTHPASLRDDLQNELGTFPLFKFWGPLTSIEATWWIARAATRIQEQFSPDLHMVYLPHLDYCLQRNGPNSPKNSKDLQEIDGVIEYLCNHINFLNHEIIILSEYGISEVNESISLNRHLRTNGFLSVREERGTETLDAGASRAFAIADHQVAHVYVRDPMDLEIVRNLLTSISGVDRVLDKTEQAAYRLAHDRSGDLVCLAQPNAWFNYFFWLDDKKAPDYARTVDIHRKPGYDPLELFFDKSIRWPKLKAGLKVVKKKLGFRTTMDLIGFETALIKGSHGVRPKDTADFPVFIYSEQMSALVARCMQHRESSDLLNPLGFFDLMVHHFDLHKDTSGATRQWLEAQRSKKESHAPNGRPVLAHQ